MAGIRGRGRGQSEVLGFALVLALVVLGSTAVVVLGASALSDTESSSQLERAEHSMTLFDSRVAMVALGQSSQQTVKFGQSNGLYSVDESAGSITISHVNYDGLNNSNSTVLYTADLGTVTYEQGRTTLAYQGGGVWAKTENGDGRMVSPPEFHYRDETLTLPIIQATGSGGGSGGTSAKVSEVPGGFTRIYPDNTTTYPAPNTTRSFGNPVENGYIRIEVDSEYYVGWATYFRQRSDGNVTVDHADETATIELLTLGDQGQIEFTGVGDTVDVRGMASGHELEEFTLALYPDESQNSGFQNLDWTLESQEGPQHLMISAQKSTGGGQLSCGDSFEVVIYYSGDGDSTYQGWKTDDMTVDCDDFDDDGDTELKADINLTDSTATAEYTKLTNSDFTSGTSTASANAYETGFQFSGHPEDDSDTISLGTTKDLSYVVNHYFALMGPDLDLTVKQGNNAQQCYTGDSGCPASGGAIDYGGGGRVVTYLHITENEIEVEFE